jgi:hypothetical protein
MRKWLFLASLAGLGGCYAYVPIDNGKPAPGNEVALELNAAASDSFAPVLGRGTRNVRGRVMSSDSLGLELALTASGPEGAERFWDGSQRLVISWNEIGSLQARRFSVGRSAIMGGALVGAAIGAAAAFNGFGIGGTTVGGTPASPQ